MSNGDKYGVDLGEKQLDRLALGCLKIPLFIVSMWCFDIVLNGIVEGRMSLEFEIVALFYVGSKLLMFSFIGPLIETIGFYISKGWHEGKIAQNEKKSE